MDSNIDSTELPAGLAPLAAAVDALAAEDLTRLPDAHAAQRVLALRSLLERLEGQWLRELAAVDARHWLHGGPTNLANLALLCRAHHRAVHEGGWHLHRHPDGHLTARPPHRRQPVAA
jgi:hypothetical protein